MNNYKSQKSQFKKSLLRTLTECCKSPLGGFRGLLLVLVLWSGCKEEGRIDHFDENAPAPAQVTAVMVRNTPGGAVLKYKLPEDENLLCVRAEYEIQPGVMREVKASRFIDSLVLEGFGNARTYNVRLYSVGRNEKMSEPVPVPVNPLTPPVRIAAKQLVENFGAISVRIENPEKASLAIVLKGDTAQSGNQIYLHTFYTSAEKANFIYRGLESAPRIFSVHLRDRWGNLSDTISARLTPWHEEFIPKNTWEEFRLPTDGLPLGNNPQYFLHKAWDGNALTPANTFVSEYAPLPQWQTWDLGVTITMNRFKLWHYENRPQNYEYMHYNQRKFELYGSMSPNPDGSWDDSWIPLGQFECVKPSGQTPPTAEDYAFARAGFEFELEANEFAPEPFVPFRYVRFKTVTVWSTLLVNPPVYIGEISFWGQILK